MAREGSKGSNASDQINLTTDDKPLVVTNNYILNFFWLQFWDSKLGSRNDTDIELDETIFIFHHLVFDLLPYGKTFNETDHFKYMKEEWDTLQQAESDKIIINQKKNIINNLNETLLNAFGWKKSEKFKRWTKEIAEFEQREAATSYILFHGIVFIFWFLFFFFDGYIAYLFAIHLVIISACMIRNTTNNKNNK